MTSYSCISCRVSFSDSELQRFHYKSDWHRYNLKRKVAELPPVTQEIFDEKLAQQQTENLEDNKDTTQFCKVCNKSFSNQNAFKNHMNSKKHKLAENKKANEKMHISSQTEKESNDVVINSNEDGGDDDEDDDWEDVGEEEIDEDSEAIPSMSCLFCHHESLSLEENLNHMTKSHSFFIPDIDYVIELENLIAYLGSKVGDGKLCLYCNKRSRTFPSTEAVQKHMRDKGHSKIDYEGDSALEFAEFYDFSSSYPDFEAQQNEDNEDDLEAETGSMEVDADTLELILPSGARAGHRSLKHFYKQSLPPAHLQFKRERAMIKNLNAEYKALGWHGTVAVATRKEMASHKTKTRAVANQNLKLGLKANKFQPHFRAQIRC